MSENLLEQLKKLLHYKKSKGFYAKRLGIGEYQVDLLLNEIRTGISELSDEEVFERIIECNEDSGTIKSSVTTSYEPKDHQELAELHKVDLTKYKISSYWTKQRGDKFTSSLLCTLIKPTDFSTEQFSEFLSTYTPPKLDIGYLVKHRDKELVDVEISLADFHLDKLTNTPETVEQRVEQYMEALTSLTNKVTASHSIDTMAFIVSNDFFHTDNYHNATTKGTPVDVSTTWNKAYEIGFDLLVKAISHLKLVSNQLEVILVSGNHDRTKSFYLAHALEVFFKNEENIYFDRGIDNTKYTVLGNTFIGYHHGDCKIDDLPLIFATNKDSSQEFGSSTYREVHTGDKHYYLTKEIKGVRVQQIPSLSGTDRWHKDNLYINNLRAALALVYHPTKGKICEFEYRIEN